MGRRERALNVISAAHRVSDGGVPLGKLIKEGHQDPMQKRVHYEYAAVLREALAGLNIEENPDRELSAEKHYFIKGQLFVKEALLRLADELEAL
jgi:hypothetical protein